MSRVGRDMDRDPHDTIERRLEAARAQLRARHAGVEPDPHFAARVAANLARVHDEPFLWAVKRVLAASLTVAAALCAFVLADLSRDNDLARDGASVSTSSGTGAATQTTVSRSADTGDDDLLAFMLGSEESR